MIWFFDRDGEKLRYEISHDRSAGCYKVIITRPDGSESVEELDEPTDASVNVISGMHKGPGVARISRKGKLSVITTHDGELYWAQVLIDGVARGRTPLLLDLPTGRYQVRIERPGFKSQVREIRVALGKAAVVRIDLTQ